jgi:hypothetical protein
MIEEYTGGDPMTKQKWVRLSLKQLRNLLRSRGHTLATVTIRRLLRKLKFSLRANRKRFTGPRHPDRDRQFRYIARQKKRFLREGCPIISVDSKKKELIGNFKNDGRAWCREAAEVNCHDFPSDAEGRGSPYGVYLPELDLGYVYVGVSADTPEFAVDAIARWWGTSGQRRFRDKREILILADSGGSNGCRPRHWKVCLQEHLADRYGLEVTVCHYPRGASKWNPVDHRLFSFISINWAAIPLRSFATVLGCIRDTKTETGLRVRATVIPKRYQIGAKVTNAKMKQLDLRRHKTCPNWNYTIRPRKKKITPPNTLPKDGK